jgi:IPT/TIG domain-containing protein
MRSSLANPCKPSPSLRIALVAALTLLLSGWTCNAMFVSCQGVVVQPQVTSLSPDTIPSDANSVLLTVDGSGFTSQSTIMWNGSSLQTTFLDSRHLQTTITQQTFESFGGSAGSSVQISVRSQASVADLGCPIGGNSATLILVIN